MVRSVFATLIGSLLSITTIGGLGFLWSSPISPDPLPQPRANWRLLEHITYENISIFPVVSSSGIDTREFLTLDEGLSTGDVIVREQGTTGMARNREGRPVAVPDYRSGASVNQLVLINRSKRPLLLLAGELVSGGKQDRIIGKDRIVPVGAPPLPLDVFCVEHGRWSAGANFVSSKTIVHPSVREEAAVSQDQSKVWEAVRGGTLSKRAPTAASPSAPPRVSMEGVGDAIARSAPTQSYDKIYQGERLGVSIDEFVAELQRRFHRSAYGLKGERVVGVIVAYGGEVAWSDIFASGDLFDLYWNKLVRSYAVEALTRPTYREVASPKSAEEFLHDLNGRETQETEPGVYRWREINEGRLAQIELDALDPGPITLHRLLLRRSS
jgi:hypothetical protein